MRKSRQRSLATDTTAPEINLSLHYKQTLAFQSHATEILYGGAAGGGKSHLMRVRAIELCTAIPGLQVYLFRRISDDLVKNHVEGPKGLKNILAPWTSHGIAEIVEGEVRFWNGSKIYLCHCKDPDDVFKYFGAEIHVLLIDELTQWLEQMYRYLRMRVRMVGLDVPEKYKSILPLILVGSNPGNVGHHWVKKTWIDNSVPMSISQTPPSEGGMLRQYIPARLEDNPSMAEDDPKYEQRLEGAGSAALVKALRHGDWDVVEGAYFDCWDSARHVIKPFHIPPTWTRFRSMDWGSARPFSVGWWTVVGDDYSAGDRILLRGALVRYREWYGASGPDTGLKMHAELVGKGIAERDFGDQVNYGVLDPSAFKEDGGPSIHERLYSGSGRKVLFRRADNARVPRGGAMGGWDQMRARLVDGMICCFETCTDSIRTIPALQHDSDRPEDLDTTGEDHAADEWRYACMSRPYVRATTEVQPIRGTGQMTMNEAWELARPKPSYDQRI